MKKAVQILLRTAFMCILTAHDTARAADKQMQKARKYSIFKNRQRVWEPHINPSETLDQQTERPVQRTERFLHVHRFLLPGLIAGAGVSKASYRQH